MGGGWHPFTAVSLALPRISDDPRDVESASLPSFGD